MQEGALGPTIAGNSERCSECLAGLVILPPMRRMALPATAILLLLLVLGAADASAGGGSSIAGATAIQPGVQEFGNTGDNSRVNNHYWAFWSLGVTASDRLVIDWEAAQRVYLELLPVGTNDFTLYHTHQMVGQYESANGKNELRFTVPQSGTIPVVFLSSLPSTYSFTAFVQHALSVRIPRISGLRHRGTVKVHVRNPEGKVISDPSLDVKLQVRRGSRWIAIGRASVAKSIAAVNYRVPRRLWGNRVLFRAVAGGGPAYLFARSKVLRMRVKR